MHHRTRCQYSFHRVGAPPDNPTTVICDEESGDWMGIGGPPSHVTDRLAQLVEKGVDFFITALAMSEREPFAADVMPQMRKLRR